MMCQQPGEMIIIIINNRMSRLLIYGIIPSLLFYINYYTNIVTPSIINTRSKHLWSLGQKLC